jgi:hypothetical protein
MDNQLGPDEHWEGNQKPTCTSTSSRKESRPIPAACKPRPARSSSGTHAIEVIAIRRRCTSSKWSPLRRAFRKNWKTGPPVPERNRLSPFGERTGPA